MKKFSIFFISALLVFGLAIQVRAEQSNASATGKNYFDNQVFTIAYNNSGSDISSDSVVILDTAGTAGTTLGAYITTTTTTDSEYVFGVIDEATCTAATSCRVCIRGPHKVWVASIDTAAGDTLGTYTPAGKVETTTSTSNKAGQLGYALAVSTDTGDGRDIWWAWIRPANQ